MLSDVSAFLAQTKAFIPLFRRFRKLGFHRVIDTGGIDDDSDGRGFLHPNQGLETVVREKNEKDEARYEGEVRDQYQHADT
ncbi:protein of unknown function [Methylocaldum szegediense]|uniref:Uncharacterized protein n=1 Tax=Methylocaldum szegediense TaxID=73780 RepID=A0ABM9I3Z7_9GAMM|nr:protein of unknown function [Methylocaldum szegediense]